MRSSARPTRKEYLQQVVNAYIAAGETWPTDLMTVAAWAIHTRHADYAPKTQIQMLAREMQAALREEYYTDPQGRRVRKKHAFGESVPDPDGLQQRTFWCDIETATPDQMRRSLQQRRRQIVGDCKQLKLDTDSYNDNNPHGANIQMLFNFEPDVIESEQDTEYNPPPPPEED